MVQGLSEETHCFRKWRIYFRGQRRLIGAFLPTVDPEGQSHFKARFLNIPFPVVTKLNYPELNSHLGHFQLSTPVKHSNDSLMISCSQEEHKWIVESGSLLCVNYKMFPIQCWTRKRGEKCHLKTVGSVPTTYWFYATYIHQHRSVSLLPHYLTHFSIPAVWLFSV